ncbi:MAG: glycosyltransferase [Terrimicrobiaceae bacterium]|nr:glycosyltransferase [Terrimicrobiaceae bacterium]
MIRVLHVIDSLDLGGAQTALLNLVTHADGSRFHHEVAAMHGEGMFGAAFRAIGVPVHSLSARRWPPAYLRNLPLLLRRGGFDIVHCHLFASNWLAKPLAAACGARCIYHHDQCNDAFRADSPLAVLVDALTNRLSTRILAVSHSVEAFNLRVEAMPPERVTYFPNSVDLSQFRPAAASERTAARAAFDLPADALIIGGVGRLTPQKNFGLLIEAAAPLLAERADVVVALFGSGPEEAALRAAAKGKPVRILGTVADRAAIYRALDVLVLPSRFEGLPMTLLEAMASGVPVLASGVDGVREIATPGEHALLAPSGNAAAFRAALRELCAGPALRERLAAAALALVRERFDARALAVELEAWYLHDLTRLGSRATAA